MHSRMIRQLLITAVAAIGAIFVCGCNNSGLISVSGTVQYPDGTPVTGEAATVIFQPENGNSPAKSASGEIAEDGSFALVTAATGDGAYPGTYKVVLKVWADYRTQKLAIPSTYSEARTTPLDAIVDKSNRKFDFIVEK